MFSDDDDEAAGGEVAYVAPKPAYSTGGPNVLVQEGVHCSMFPDEFCFFCAYEKNTETQGSEADLYSSLVDLVQHQSDLKREPAAIAQHIFSQYNSAVRPHVPNQPVWTRASITRHIIYGGQFTAIFDTSISAMFTSLIARQNAALVDAVTGTVIEDNRKAFCDTVSSYVKWKNASGKKTAGSSRA